VLPPPPPPLPPPPEEELCELDVLVLEEVVVDELVSTAVDVVEVVSEVDDELDFDELAKGVKVVMPEAPEEIALISMVHLLARNGIPCLIYRQVPL